MDIRENKLGFYYKFYEEKNPEAWVTYETYRTKTDICETRKKVRNERDGMQDN